MTARRSPVRVCALLRFFRPVYGGAGEQALSLARRLRTAGVDTLVVTARFPGLPAAGEVEGIPVRRLPLRPETALGRLWCAAEVVAFLARTRRTYDVLHLHGVYRWFSYAAILGAKVLGKPVVLKLTLVGGDDPLSVRGQFFGGLKQAILKLADRTVCVSDAMYRQAVDAGYQPSRLFRIPNGVDVAKFRPAPAAERREIRAALGLPADRLLVVFAGVLTGRKGVDILLEAWRAVSSTHPGAHLVLLGPRSDPHNRFSDEVTDTLEERIRACAPGSVTTPGRVGNIEQFLRAADLFVFPSRSEGLPNALLEALACGLPSIASRIDGVVDVAGGDEVLLVEPGDATPLAAALGRLLDDPDLRDRLGRVARARMEERFSLEAVALRYADEYRGLMRGDHRNSS